MVLILLFLRIMYLFWGNAMSEFNEWELERLLTYIEYCLDNFKDEPIRYLELRNKLYNKLYSQPAKVSDEILNSEQVGVLTESQREEIINRLNGTMKMLRQSIVKQDLM